MDEHNGGVAAVVAGDQAAAAAIASQDIRITMPPYPCSRPFELPPTL